MAAERNIYVRQGDTFTHSLILWDGYDESGNKIPLDLDGFSFQSQIREAGEDGRFSDAGEMFANEEETIFSEFETEILDNIVTCTLSSERSEIVPPGRHWYDIQAETPGGIVTYLYGTIIFLPRIA